MVLNFEDQSGLQYKRNRHYNPLAGQFTQEDPIGLAGGLNLYGFAGGDPVNLSDPFGLCVDGLTTIACIAAAVAIGAAVLGASRTIRNAFNDLPVGEGVGREMAMGGAVGGLMISGAALLTSGSAVAGGVAAAAGAAAPAVGTSFGRLGTVAQTQSISVARFTAHGAARAVERGVSTETINSTVLNPLVSLSQAGGERFLQVSQQAAVAIDKAGNVITVIDRANFDEGLMNVLRSFGGS